MVRMLSTKMLTGKTWPMSAVRARARTMLITLSTSGMVAASTAPKTMTSTIRAAGTPKISPRERSFSASSVNIWLRLASPAWAMVKPSLWPVMAASWTLVDVLHRVVDAARHDHRDERRVLVLGDQAGILGRVVGGGAGDDVAAERVDRGGDLEHVGLEGRLADGQVRRSDDHEVGDLVWAAQSVLDETVGDHAVGLARAELAVGGDAAVQQSGDADHREDDEQRVHRDGAPGMECGGAGEPLRESRTGLEGLCVPCHVRTPR